MTQPLRLSGLNLVAAGILAISLPAQRSLIGQEPDSEGDAPTAETESTAILPLESGPIHEAFAEPVTLNAEADIIVPQEPPERVPELPPEVRPLGENVLWIPGYWAWSETSDDFIWVSGVWRDAPPGQRWVPGYWTEAEGGYQWTHGFWIAADSEELVYLPEPPESLESQPTAPRPDPDHFWIPGCWRWNDGQYYWRGGFWQPAQANWIWVPAQYRYTPLGYVYQRGYWDYPLPRRGLLFAPVYFRDPVYLRGGYYFTPNSWIDVAVLTTGLFVSPSRGHYFYGDFYGPRYVSAGFYPWYQYQDYRYGYDPLFSYHSWRYGSRDSAWFENLRDGYRRREQVARDEQNRPDVARAEHDRPESLVSPDANREQTGFVHSLSELPEERGAELIRIDETQRYEAAEQTRHRFGEFRQQRREVEARERTDVIRDPDQGANDPARVTERDRANQDGRPNAATGEPQVRPAGPPRGRFQLPEREQRSGTDRNRSSGGRESSGRRPATQVPQRPAQTQQRGDRNEGRSGGSVRESPRDRGNHDDHEPRGNQGDRSQQRN